MGSIKAKKIIECLSNVFPDEELCDAGNGQIHIYNPHDETKLKIMALTRGFILDDEIVILTQNVDLPSLLIASKNEDQRKKNLVVSLPLINAVIAHVGEQFFFNGDMLVATDKPGFGSALIGLDTAAAIHLISYEKSLLIFSADPAKLEKYAQDNKLDLQIIIRRPAANTAGECIAPGFSD